MIFNTLTCSKQFSPLKVVSSVLLNSDFISVSKTEEEDWAVLKTMLSAKIGTELQNNNKIFENKEKT